MNPEDSLSDLQHDKWQHYPDVDREWWTPPLTNYVSEALQANVPQKILVVGIGGLARDALEYAKLSGVDVTGIDINSQAVESAIERDGQENVAFSIGDILDPTIVETLGREKFGAVAFVGLLTNLITDADASTALSNTYQLLAPGGSLVLSDYALGEGKEYWLGRYEKDAQALEKAGYGSRDELFGTIIVRPNGLHAEQLRRIRTEELVEDLCVGNFERLARHRRLDSVSEMLAKVGFCMPLARVQTQQLAKVPINLSHPWEQETNIQIQAIKPLQQRTRR